MTEQEKNKKIKEILEEWKKEADKIPEKKQSKEKSMLDNGHTGNFYELTEKYKKIIDKIKNS